GQRQSGGKKHSTGTRKDSKWLRGTLTECSKAVVRTKGTYLSAATTGSRAAAGTPKPRSRPATRS
ncbi:MAG: IS110 family transposase, partial [Actinobacteria bacterium]|nr:IS110 family transposase [Actinomycetota bacterium]